MENLQNPPNNEPAENAATETNKGKKTAWVSVDEWISKFRLTFTNGKLPGILPPMKAVGYSDEKLNALLEETNNLETLSQKQKKEYGEQYAETEKLDILRANIDTTYRKHRNLARIVFKDDTKAITTLKLYERPKTSYSGWLQLVLNFYAQLNDSPEMLAKATTASVNAAAVEDALAQLETLRALKKSQRKELAEAQAATEARDKAFDELYPKYREFVDYAKILLSDNQSLEALGIVVKR